MPRSRHTPIQGAVRLCCQTIGVIWLSLAAPSASAAALSPEQLLDADIDTLIQIETAVDAGRFPQKRIHAPTRVTIVTAEDIEAYGYRTLADVLRSMRGLFTTYDRNYHYLGTRGFARPGDYNTRVMILIDGMRLADPVYNQGSIGSDFPVDISLIKRVEFLPGPGSSAYGNNALLGLINIVTRDPVPTDSQQIRVEAGNNGRAGLQVTLDRLLAPSARLMLSASRVRSSGANHYYPEFDAPSTNHGRAEGLDSEARNRLFAKLLLDQWHLQLIASQRDKGVPTGSFQQQFNDRRSRTEDDYLMVSAARTLRLSDDSSANIRASYSRYDYTGHYPYDYPPVTLTEDRGLGEQIGLEASWISQAIDRHTLRVWGEVFYDRRIEQSNVDLDPYQSYLQDRRQGRHWGFFAEDEFRFAPRWQLNLGMRWDRQWTGNITAHPRLGLIHLLSDSTTLKLLYGSASRAPTAYERYYAIDGFNVANPDLSAETIRTLEAVYEYQTDGLRLSGSAFRYRISDLIDSVTDPNDDTVSFRNVAQATAHGIELEAELARANGDRLGLSYTWQRSVDDGTGKALTNVPRHMLKANWLAYWTPRLQSGLEVQYESRRDTLEGGHTGGRTLVNLSLLSRHLPGGATLRASLFNLLDRRYSEPASLDHVQHRLAQDGRSLGVVLTWPL
ncbi:TonB-dependent receptor plug domain-containing protein [Denitromonas iodatirespirans]|uniref:TonB-dependent receptor n=1 Tax=Denitromonas iodatirespirans TaxID=2795389 RepID=A0A944HE60_DENI1|nr:TonB-dependent receptor [Denitromonas iodatirespirans]MBT0962621.1 TonB-dependent receptor [Denitromonas iodatirespirans]